MKGKIVGMMTALAMFVAGFAVQAATLTWQGPDGGVWSEAGNWTDESGANAVPQDGDRLVIPSRTEPITLENNIANLTLARIAFTGTGASVTLTGKAYALDNPKYTTQNSSSRAEWPFVAEDCTVTNVPPVALRNSSASNRNFGICTGKTVTFASDVTGDIPGVIYLDKFDNGTAVNFLGKLTLTEATILSRSWSFNVSFYGPIHVKYVNYPTASDVSCTYNFCASGNVFENWALASWGTYAIKAADALPANVVFGWQYPSASRKSSYQIQLGSGNRVVIDHVEASDPAQLYPGGTFNNDSCYIQGYSGTLTMRSTQSTVCYARFSGWFDVEWDPVGDYTIDLRDRVHDLKGYSFNVCRGRAILNGMTQLACEKLAIGANAVLDVACTNGIALPSAKYLTMDAGSRLYITNAAVRAFTANQAELTINDGAYIEIGDGVAAPSFKKVTAYGVPLADGNYTGADGVAGATKVPWLRGSAVITVSQSSIPTNVNYWKSAVDGDMSEASKWTLGAPASGQYDYIQAQGADYTVTAAGDVSFANRLLLAGSSLHTTTFSTTGRFSSSREIYVEEGAVLDVPTGGVLWHSSGNEPSLKVSPGGELRVSGGLCVLTNSCVKCASVVGTSAKTATVSVTSGRLTLFSNSQQLKLGDYARLDVSGGELVFDDGDGSWGVIEHLKTTPKSRVSVSGSGRVRLSGVVTGQIYGDGVTDFSGNASYWNWNLKPGGNYKYGGQMGVRASAGETAEWTIRDHAVIEYGNDARFYVGNTGIDYSGSRSIVRFLSDAEHGSTTNNGMRIKSDPHIANYFQLGCGNGYGLCEIANGFVPFGSYGVRIGSSENWGKTPAPTDTVGCTGVVHMTGGKFLCTGSYNWSTETLVPAGTMFGWGWPTKAEAGRPYNGIMEMTGGVFSNRTHLVLGMYRGTGEWRQSGGYTIQCQASHGLMIGVAGGSGRLELSGGTFKTTYNAYVGGVPVTAFSNQAMLLDNGYPSNRHDAVGVLSVSGGAFISDGYWDSPLYVGKDGDGTIEMDGPNGSFTANRLILAADTVDGTKTKATLRFKLDAEGNVAPIVVRNSLSISADSKLVIDATACPEDLVGRIKLLQAGSVTGTFAPENITILGAPKVAGKMSVSWRGTTLSLQRGAQGLLMIVR